MQPPGHRFIIDPSPPGAPESWVGGVSVPVHGEAPPKGVCTSPGGSPRAPPPPPRAEAPDNASARCRSPSAAPPPPCPPGCPGADSSQCFTGTRRPSGAGPSWRHPASSSRSPRRGQRDFGIRPEPDRGQPPLDSDALTPCLRDAARGRPVDPEAQAPTAAPVPQFRATFGGPRVDGHPMSHIPQREHELRSAMGRPTPCGKPSGKDELAVPACFVRVLLTDYSSS